MVLSPLVLVLRGLGIGIGIEGQNFDSIGIGIGIEGPSIDFWYWYWYWYCNPWLISEKVNHDLSQKFRLFEFLISQKDRELQKIH